MMMFKPSILGLLLTSVGLFAVTPVAAQELQPGDASSAADDFNGGDIVVTAQRREQKLIDVPISVSAVDRAALDRAGVRNVSDIGTAVPNIQINQTIGNNFGPLITIRGLSPSGDTSLGRDQPVGLYLDGVPIAKSTGAAFDTVDLQRVEVLRGPQGTLYGKNTIGGAVNLVTEKPTGEFGGMLALGAGEFGRFTQRLTVNLPEIANVSAKVAVSSKQNRGFYRNNALGNHLGQEDLVAGRVDLVWKPSDAFTASYAYDITDSNGTPANLAISAGGLFPATHPLIAGNVYTSRPDKGISAQSALASDFRVNGHALTLEYNLDGGALGDVTLKSITARRKTYTYSASDFDGTANDILRIILENNYRQFTQEFQIIGSGADVNYTLGAFYLKDSYTSFNPRWNVQFGGNNFDLSERSGGSKSYAGYGQVAWTPSFAEENLTVSVGARYTREEKRAGELFLGNSAYRTNPAAPNAGVFARNPDGTPITRSGQPAAGARPGAGGIGPSDLIPLANSGVWTQFNPEFNLLYKLQRDWSVYGRVATGFKSGGISDTAPTNAAFNTPYNPEKLLSFEAGTKFSSFDRRLNISAAVYHSIYTDFQAGVFVPQLVTTNIINAGEAKFTGIELEGSVRPVEGLTFNFGFGYIDARYSDFVLPNGTDVTKTYKVPLVPKYNYQLGGLYQVPVGIGTLEASLNYSWRARQFSGIDGDPLTIRKAYGLLDGRVALTDIELGGGSSLEFSLWGKNLTDKEYWVSSLNLTLFTLRQWGDPRSFGAEAKLRF